MCVHALRVLHSFPTRRSSDLQSSLAVGAVKFGEAVQSIVASRPAVPIVGACVSTAVITCVLVAEWLPYVSVASDVWVYVCLQFIPVVLLFSRLTVAPLQSSLAVGAVKFGEAVQSIVASRPGLAEGGAGVSTAVITCVLVAEWLPQASVASQVWV